MSFENALVTKGIMVGSALASILVGLFDTKHYFHLQYVPHISKHHQYWRLITNHFVFSNSSDLFLAEIILFNVGIQVERQFGSVKYASFALVTTLLVTILEFLALLLFHRAGLNYISMGPSALVFGILHQHSRIVPAAYHYRIFGVSLNNKSVTFILALQLAISRPPGSAAIAIIGFFASQIYCSDLANLKSYRISRSVVQLFSRFVLPLLGSNRPVRRSNRALPDGRGSGSTGGQVETTDSAGQSTENLTRSDGVEEAATSARAHLASASIITTGRSRNNERETEVPGSTGTGSVMREWVNELTGRADRVNAGIRIPRDTEIDLLTTMFPDIEREVVVAALQRSVNVESAVETLLSSQR